jgi:hypothetical protein
MPTGSRSQPHAATYPRQTWPTPPLPEWGIPPTREGPLSNARCELLLEAGARYERTLEAVSSTPFRG